MYIQRVRRRSFGAANLLYLHRQNIRRNFIMVYADDAIFAEGTRDVHIQTARHDEADTIKHQHSETPFWNPIDQTDTYDNDSCWLPHYTILTLLLLSCPGHGTDMGACMHAFKHGMEHQQQVHLTLDDGRELGYSRWWWNFYFYYIGVRCCNLRQLMGECAEWANACMWVSITSIRNHRKVVTKAKYYMDAVSGGGQTRPGWHIQQEELDRDTIFDDSNIVDRPAGVEKVVKYAFQENGPEAEYIIVLYSGYISTWNRRDRSKTSYGTVF